MIQKRERLYLNIVKGIAVFLMLWGHCIQFCANGVFDVFENSTFQFIYSFHMPLFMLVSGYLFYFSYEKRDLKTLLIHRTQGMLQPIVFASMLNTFLMELPTVILHGGVQFTNGKLFTGFYTMWFLWCVLSCSTAVALAGKLARNSWSRLLLIVCGVFLVALFPENHYHVYMYPYFVAGFYYGMYRNRIPGWLKKCAWLSLAVFPMLLTRYESWHLIYVSPIYSPQWDLLPMLQLNGFRWMIGFAGSLFVLVITDFAVKLFAGRKKIPAALTMLAKLGENSLAIYCISVSLLSHYLMKIFDRFGQVTSWNLTLYNYVMTPLIALAYAVGLYVVVQLLKKWKVHNFIFGR